MRKIFVTGLAVVVLVVAALPAVVITAGGGFGNSVANAAENFSGYSFSAQAQYNKGKKGKKCKGQGDGGPKCQKKGGKKGGDGRGGKGDGGPRRQ